MKKAIWIIFLLGLVARAAAQEQLTKRQLADQLFERYEYYKSLQLYLDLAKKSNPDVSIAERIAECYRLMNDDDHAEQWYSTALNYTAADVADIYYYAEELLRNQKIKEAREQYKRYYGKVNASGELKFKLATCDSAEKWMKEFPVYAVSGDDMLNSRYSDWGLSYYGADQFVFVSNRKEDNPHLKGTNPRTGNGFFNLYYTSKDSILSVPVDTQSPVFNGNYDEGPMVLNACGDTAYITITTTVAAKHLPVTRGEENAQRLYTRRLQLIVAVKSNGKWGNLKSFPYNNVQEYSVGHAALSRDGRLLYFASDMPGGEGKTDIWYCEKQPDGTWGKPVNCGKAINTPDEEAFPTIIGDKLSFASKGLPGMGGFDIFIADGAKSSWAQPHNLKYPINNTKDDFYLVSKSAELLDGYLSSNRNSEASNDDIYFFYSRLVSKTAPAQAPPADTAKLPAPVPPVSKTTGQPLLATIYYDLDKSNIRPDAVPQLVMLIRLLKAHPEMQIELSSYTDSRASSAYNMELSKRRSASAVAYLVQHGIAANRITVKSYGEQHLVNQCADNVPCTEAEQQLNRRTEFKLLAQ